MYAFFRGETVPQYSVSHDLFLLHPKIRQITVVLFGCFSTVYFQRFSLFSRFLYSILPTVSFLWSWFSSLAVICTFWYFCICWYLVLLVFCLHVWAPRLICISSCSLFSFLILPSAVLKWFVVILLKWGLNCRTIPLGGNYVVF